MAKKQFFAIVDTETTADDNVYDFGVVICDRQGKIHASCSVIVAESVDKELFFDPNASGLWSRRYAAEKKAKYAGMLENGTRMLASVNAINRWLEKANAKFSPTLTAYNLAFDRSKCGNTGIDVSMFADSFCLWHLACSVYAESKAYRNFAMANHYFGNRTQHGNMTYKTNAEVMAHFVTGKFSEEPHTALEDAQFYELPILASILKKKEWRKHIGKPYNWKAYQLRDHFQAK